MSESPNDERTDEQSPARPEPDELKLIEDPTPEQRLVAQQLFPPELAPDEGPVAKVPNNVTVTVSIAVPSWLVDVLAWRLEEYDGADEERLDDLVLDYLQPDYQFLTPDDERLEDVLLDDVDEERDAE